MAGQIVWLEGRDVDPGEVGVRAAVLAQLRAAGVSVPRGFVLGRSLLHAFTESAREQDRAHVPVKLTADVQRQISEALRSLGGSFAIRRSPFDDGAGERRADWMLSTKGGRPERETYLHLMDAAEVSEAVRRIWGQGLLTSAPPPPLAIMVQRFMPPEVCAIVRRDRVDPDLLHVVSTLGVGDLLAAGLVVPDRHTLRRDGTVLASSLGRKAQMTVPRSEGGVVRVPVPPSAARRPAMDDGHIEALAATWRAGESAADGLLALGAAWSGGRWWVTGAAAARVADEEQVMTG